MPDLGDHDADPGDHDGSIWVITMARRTQPVNMRKSFDGLSAEVRSVLAQDPLSGHVFVFLNRRRTMMKLLLWTRGGFTIVHKRLERGTFTFVQQITDEVAQVEIDAHELSMLLEGIDATTARVSRRWEPPAHQRIA